MADIFISYVEEDSEVMTALSVGLEASGYSTWCYERHSVPGPSYLAQTREAIEQCRVFMLVVSRDSLGSTQIDKEVVRAHETGKRFLPVLRGVTHPEFHARQPEWGQAAGGATAIVIPLGGVNEILPRIVRGLKMMRIEPSTALEATPLPPPQPASSTRLVPESERPVARESPRPSVTLLERAKRLITHSVAASQCGHSDTVTQSRGSNFGVRLPSRAEVGFILRLLVVALLLALIAALVIAWRLRSSPILP